MHRPAQLPPQPFESTIRKLTRRATQTGSKPPHSSCPIALCRCFTAAMCGHRSVHGTTGCTGRWLACIDGLSARTPHCRYSDHVGAPLEASPDEHCLMTSAGRHRQGLICEYRRRGHQQQHSIMRLAPDACAGRHRHAGVNSSQHACLQLAPSCSWRLRCRSPLGARAPNPAHSRVITS